VLDRAGKTSRNRISPQARPFASEVLKVVVLASLFSQKALAAASALLVSASHKAILRPVSCSTRPASLERRCFKQMIQPSLLGSGGRN